MQKKYLLYGGGLMVLMLIVGVVWLYASPQMASQSSQYTDIVDSPVRGLSPQEVDDLLAGRGAGYARTAELNSYPGPRHVLDMHSELALSEEEVTQVQVLFDEMESEAQQLGDEIVQREAALSQAFAEDTLTPDEMRAQVEELAMLYGQLRATHLEAHFHTTDILSHEQVMAYDRLRGYFGNDHDSLDHQQHESH